jgi:hypothetical protein
MVVNYTLYNKELDKRLMHPRVGLWFTSNLEEAKKMLIDCHNFVGDDCKRNFIIIDVDTGKETLL